VIIPRAFAAEERPAHARSPDLPPLSDHNGPERSGQLNHPIPMRSRAYRAPDATLLSQSLLRCRALRPRRQLATRMTRARARASENTSRQVKQSSAGRVGGGKGEGGRGLLRGRGRGWVSLARYKFNAPPLLGSPRVRYPVAPTSVRRALIIQHNRTGTIIIPGISRNWSPSPHPTACMLSRVRINPDREDYGGRLGRPLELLVTDSFSGAEHKFACG